MDFHLTKIGNEFYQGTMKRIAHSLEKLAQEKITIAKLYPINEIDEVCTEQFAKGNSFVSCTLIDAEWALLAFEVEKE